MVRTPLVVLMACAVLSSVQARSGTAGRLGVAGEATAYEVPYVDRIEPGEVRRRSFDLYFPTKTERPPPLVIFVYGSFWILPDDNYGIGPALAKRLVKENIAVALVRYRLAPASQHPVPAQDVAAAIARLIRDATKYGYDPERIFLVGHSAGAHLASLVALDAAYLNRHGLTPGVLAGVVSISGLYDLSPTRNMFDSHRAAVINAFGPDSAVLQKASPVQHVRADAPPFLIFAAADDLFGFQLDAKRFADALRDAGVPDTAQYIIPDRDHFSVVELKEDNPVENLLLQFIGVKPLSTHLRQWTSFKKTWQAPPYSTEAFWRFKDLIRPYPADARFVARLAGSYGPAKHELLELALDNFHAIRLFDYLDSAPEDEVGRGEFLVMTNVRNEVQIWRREDIEPYDPVIVVGVDDERNLFRLAMFYRMFREYSWKETPPPPVMARPVGGFIHFLEEPPPELQPRVWHSGVTIDSLKLVEQNPLEPVSDLPRVVYETLTHRNGCIYCHEFRGIGPRSHHNLAATGKPHGGFALPLEQYPDEVLRTFIFDQEAVAKQMGATPNVIVKEARTQFHDLIVRSRNENRQTNDAGTR